MLISFMFLAYLGLNPIDISKYYGARFGSAIGMSVSIPENPINKIALQLKDKEDRLDKRELELDKREAELKSNLNNNQFIVLLMGAGILFLFFLIIINFYLDKRYRNKNND